MFLIFLKPKNLAPNRIISIRHDDQCKLKSGTGIPKRIE